MTEAALDRAMAFYRQHPSIPGALASAGLRGSDFIKGWKRREEPLDIGLIDEASMLDERQYADLRALFSDAGALRRPGAARAGRAARGGMVFDTLPEEAQLTLQPGAPAGGGQPDPRPRRTPSAIRRWASTTSRRWSGRPRARRPRRPRRAGRRRRDGARAGAGLAQRDAGAADQRLPRGPRRAARRAAAGRAADLRRDRAAAEASPPAHGPRGARADQGRADDLPRAGRAARASRGCTSSAPRTRASASRASSRSSRPSEEEPKIVSAASMGAVFLHGAAVTIHKAQGSQWSEVQVFAPDLYAAAQSGRQRGRAAALEAARLRRGDPGRGAAASG